jgi:hypothetical protein
VDYSDPWVSRARLQRAPEEALGTVIPWVRERPGQMAELQAAWIGPPVPAPRAPVIYDTVDVHWLRESRRAALGGGEERSPRVVALREIELALILATDATLVVTEAERAQVLGTSPTRACR